MFGSNNYGQLGLGHMKTVNKPSCIKSECSLNSSIVRKSWNLLLSSD
jgi:hypothetical protein